jgi:FAD/FMN-containing dehydrogenase
MKKRRVFKLIFFVFFIALGVHISIEPLYTPTAISTPAHHFLFPRYIAHKALVSKNHKGNTFEALEEALASYVDGIEVDIRLSRDNVPFLYHGETLEEATNGKGIPEDHTWEQLQQLFYLDATQSKLVSLEDIFKLIGSQKYLFLDIKTSTLFNFNHNFAKEIAELIQQYHLQDSVIVESFNPFFLMAMRLSDRYVLLMYDFTVKASAIGEEVQSQFDKIPWLLKQPFFQKQIRRIVRPDILGPSWNLEEGLLKSLIEHGYPLICWTVDDDKIANKLFKLGVKGLQTNNPIELMQSLPETEKVVYDAGGTKSQVNRIIYVRNNQDIINALQEAKKTNKKITMAGRRHSMGGQTLLDGSIHLSMLRMDSVRYNQETSSVIVGAGATWKKIQSILNGFGRSVKVMQSDNIFTVGGSISANVHGWQVGEPPLSSTILSMKIITADGEIRDISKDTEPELFSAVMGGYGQFGVIVEAELATVPNSTLKFHAAYMEPQQFAEKFQNLVTKNNKVELAYGRLSVDRGHLFEEAGLFWFEKSDLAVTTRLPPERLVALKRAIFRASQYLELGKTIRWSAEKIYAQQLTSAPSVSRNFAMNADIHILWPLYGENKDILQEYFIPKNKIYEFLVALKNLILLHDMNLLNATIREVRKDDISGLPYANKDVFAFVLLFSQAQNPESERKMTEFTKKVIDEVLKLDGTFYLPYRLHYTKDQILKAYPTLSKWIKLKETWDPDKIFYSQFFDHIQSLLYSPYTIFKKG